MKIKDYIILFLLGLSFFLFISKDERVETKIITKVDTVKVSYVDTVYKFKTKIKRTLVRDTVVTVDSFYINDTVFVDYNTRFRLGSDTLNCTGIVHFDMNNFRFNDVSFKYPTRTVFQTKLITKPNWTYTIVGTAIGVIVGVLVR